MNNGILDSVDRRALIRLVVVYYHRSQICESSPLHVRAYRLTRSHLGVAFFQKLQGVAFFLGMGRFPLSFSFNLILNPENWTHFEFTCFLINPIWMVNATETRDVLSPSLSFLASTICSI